MKKPVALIIMDGFGISNKRKGNAISNAKKPNLTYLKNYYPHAKLGASGLDVGLPEGQMGNSEVGHLNLGAGRIVYQSLTRINLSIKDQTFYDNEVFLKAISHVKKNHSKLHILGLVSDGGVHSHLNHILALLDLAKKKDVKDVYVHAILDGRDVLPESASIYLKEVMKKGQIATASGRYFAMDRDKNWDRLQKAYDMMVLGSNQEIDILTGLENSYKNEKADEFVEPFMANKNGLVSDNDAIIFANFRPDRAIEMALAFTNIKETNLKPHPINNLYFVQMMAYSEKVIGEVAFHNDDLKNTLGDIIAKENLKQLRIAETEKYAHVTFFFDGGTDHEIKGSKRILVNSPKVATYDLKPEMSAYEVTEKVLYEIENDCPDLIILNFANCDMVGHTADMEAVVKAVMVVDECIGKVRKAIAKKKGICIITADHGNAEKILDEKGEKFTAHTSNLVPVIITDRNVKVRDGILADIAPTILKYLGINIPKEMNGKPLIEELV